MFFLCLLNELVNVDNFDAMVELLYALRYLTLGTADDR